MKSAGYLEKLNQLSPLTNLAIESLIQLSQAVTVDKEDLTWDERDDLTRLIADKLLEILCIRSIHRERAKKRFRTADIVNDLPGRQLLQEPIPDNIY